MPAQVAVERRWCSFFERWLTRSRAAASCVSSASRTCSRVGSGLGSGVGLGSGLGPGLGLGARHAPARPSDCGGPRAPCRPFAARTRHRPAVRRSCAGTCARGRRGSASAPSSRARRRTSAVASCLARSAAAAPAACPGGHARTARSRGPWRSTRPPPAARPAHGAPTAIGRPSGSPCPSAPPPPYTSRRREGRSPRRVLRWGSGRGGRQGAITERRSGEAGRRHTSQREEGSHAATHSTATSAARGNDSRGKDLWLLALNILRVEARNTQPDRSILF